MLTSPFLYTALLLASPVAVIEDLAALDQRITATLQNQGARARPIDKRIRLARCPVPASIDVQSATAVAVRCAAIGWRIRVAIVRGSHTDTDAGNGPRQNAVIIRRYESVELRIAGAGFAVTANAVAMESGAIGDSIRIKSPTFRTPVAARIVGKGLVEIRQ